MLLLYITLDGCGWSSSFLQAAPVVVFHRQLNGNGSGNNDDSGAGKDITIDSVTNYCCHISQLFVQESNHVLNPQVTTLCHAVAI